jgi:transposase, IS6 family
MPVTDPNNPFKWRHYESEIILLNVRWYCRYALSYRDLKEMMIERGIEVVHTTIYRDETYVKVKGKWKYLYRAIDSDGNSLDFMLSAKRDKASAIRFFKKVLYAQHSSIPRVINVDKNAAYPPAMKDLKEAELLPVETELRQVKYLNNLIEQDHLFIKRLTNPGLGFGSFNTARRTIRGYESMNMLRKGQVEGVEKGDVMGQLSFIHEIFGVVA